MEGVRTTCSANVQQLERDENHLFLTVQLETLKLEPGAVSAEGLQAALAGGCTCLDLGSGGCGHMHLVSNCVVSVCATHQCWMRRPE